MTETQRDLLSAAFSLTLIALAAFVMHRFFLPLIWAGILCVATWPLYQRMPVSAATMCWPPPC
jgi:predicted PurR-regulated permease PerM